MIEMTPAERRVVLAGLVSSNALTDEEFEQCFAAMFARLREARGGTQLDQMRAERDEARAELERLRGLNVAVYDLRAAEGITPGGLRRYLTERGWERADDGPSAEVWNRSGQLRWGEPQLLVSLHPDASNYASRTVILINDLARDEKRGALGVLADLRAASREATP